MHNAPPLELSHLGTPPARSRGTGSIAGAVRRIASRLRRVTDMGLEEIGYRGWQESSKWIDRIRLDGRVPDPTTVLRRYAPALADPTAARHALSAAIADRFFAGLALDSIAEVRVRFPETRRHILADADVLRGRHFDLLGYRGLWFGNPIDWHLDPVQSKRAPLVHWSGIDHLDPAAVGDSKVVWELNRHQWVVRLAQAHALGRDERYAAAAIQAIDEWIDANPPGYGINWASSLEVSYRLISWIWVLSLLRQSTSLSDRTLTRMLASIQAHAAHVLKYLSYYYSPNTHLTGEALGLFYAGTVFPEYRDAGRWRDAGAAILIEQADRQISDDGVYMEQSTCYQRYTCEIYLHFLLLAERNGLPVPDRTREQLTQMLDFLLAVRRPDGSMPAIGDADGGQLMPLAARAADDYRGLFAVAAAVFDRSDYAWAAGDREPEVLWLLGRDGANTFTRAGLEPPATAPSRIFTSGGYAILRNGWDRDAHQLIMDIGPLGCHVSSGHGHADLLSIQCSIFGEACLVDAGTYGYTAEPEWRDHFRGSAAHSTVTVDGQDQAGPNGPFRWRRHPRVRLREWLSTAEYDLVDAEHDAYRSMKSPVIHRRRAIFVKPEFWILVDDLLGDGSHSAALSFQFAPLQVTRPSGLWARAETNGGSVLWIAPVSATPLTASLKTGETAPIRGWHSPDYGQRIAAPNLVYHAAASLPARIVTVLYPTRDRQAAPPSLSAINDRDGLLSGVSVNDTTVALDGPHVRISPAKAGHHSHS